MQSFEMPQIQLITVNLNSDPALGSNDLGFVPYGSESGYSENTLKIISVD